MSSHNYHTTTCSGPVSSQGKDSVVEIDFMTKREDPRFVEKICGKETVLDTSNSSSQFDESEAKSFVCSIDENEVKEGSSDDSF